MFVCGDGTNERSENEIIKSIELICIYNINCCGKMHETS